MHPMTSNDIENYKVNATPYMYYKYPQITKLQSFCSKVNHFWVAGHFETNALNDSKCPWTLQIKCTTGTCMLYYNSQVPNFILFHSTISHFWDICNLLFPIDPNTLNLKLFSYFKFQNSRKSLLCELSQGTAIKLPKQEAKGLWCSAWPFARWNQHSFMDTGIVADW